MLGVDTVGIAAIVAPIFVGLIGVAWRIGALESKVRDIKDDVNEVKADVKDIQRVAHRGNNR